MSQAQKESETTRFRPTVETEASAAEDLDDRGDVIWGFSKDKVPEMGVEENVSKFGTRFDAGAVPTGSTLVMMKVAVEDATIPAELPSTIELKPLLSSIPAASPKPALMIGVSGSPFSGKNSLVNLLSSVFYASNPVFVIHQHDFAVPRHLLLPSGTGEVDVHSREAFDLTSLARVIRYAKGKGRLPEPLIALRDDGNDREKETAIFTASVVAEMIDVVCSSGIMEGGRAVGLVEGGLLYCDTEIRELLDLKILLRGRKDIAIDRWFETQGSTEGLTREEFDDTKWKKYADEHGALFRKGDVEGTPIWKVCEALEIQVQLGLNDTLEDTLRWVVETIIDSCRSSEEVEQRGLELEVDRVLLHQYDLCDCREGWLGRTRQILLNLV